MVPEARVRDAHGVHDPHRGRAEVERRQEGGGEEVAVERQEVRLARLDVVLHEALQRAEVVELVHCGGRRTGRRPAASAVSDADADADAEE